MKELLCKITGEEIQISHEYFHNTCSQKEMCSVPNLKEKKEGKEKEKCQCN